MTLLTRRISTHSSSAPSQGSHRRAVVWALLTLGAGVWWVTLAPTALGGPSAFVVTQGESMLPDYEPDGLVITQESDSYEVGDVVAYRSPKLDATVLHRIVAIDGDRYVLRGDNNDFLDEFHPTDEDIVGREWLHAPGAGDYLRLLQNPLHFAAIIGAIALLSVRVPRRARRRQRHRTR